MYTSATTISLTIAPKIAGIAKKKEKRKHSFLLTPKNKPVATVIPDLEIPGKRERICAVPMRKELT